MTRPSRRHSWSLSAGPDDGLTSGDLTEKVMRWNGSGHVGPRPRLCSLFAFLGTRPACLEQLGLAADALEAGGSGEGPCEPFGVTDCVARRSCHQYCSWRGDFGDATGDIDRTAEPVAGAADCPTRRDTDPQFWQGLVTLSGFRQSHHRVQQFDGIRTDQHDRVADSLDQSDRWVHDVAG